MDRSLLARSGVGVKRLEDLRAWQLARAFKIETYRRVKASPAAMVDLRFKQQLMDAAARPEANIAEGFRRFAAADFARFLSYAAGSIDEALSWLQDGIDRDYLADDDCREAFRLGTAAIKTITALQTSLRKFSAKPRPHPKPPTEPDEEQPRRTKDEMD